MKCGEIGVDYDPEESRSLEHLKRVRDKSPLCELFFALLEDERSANFTVSAYLNSVRPYLVISHSVLQGEEKVVIIETFPIPTVEGILTTTRAHLHRLRVGLTVKAEQLQNQIDALEQAEQLLTPMKEVAKSPACT